LPTINFNTRLRFRFDAYVAQSVEPMRITSDFPAAVLSF